MKIYTADQKSAIKIDAPHDPDAELFYGFKYKAELWAANKAYRKDKHIILPSIFNGYYYLIDSNGISGNTEPDWPTITKATVEGGTVSYKAVEYNLFLGEGETLTASTWVATESVPVTNDSFDVSGETSAMFGPIPGAVTEFTITNSVVKSTGEKDDRSMIITVSER